MAMCLPSTARRQVLVVSSGAKPGSNFLPPFFSLGAAQHFVFIDRDDGFTHLGYELTDGKPTCLSVSKLSYCPNSSLLVYHSLTHKVPFLCVFLQGGVAFSCSPAFSSLFCSSSTTAVAAARSRHFFFFAMIVSLAFSMLSFPQPTQN